MNFQERLANYVLGNVSSSQLPDIALAALNQNIESESILILAGMSDKDTPFEHEQYFNASLRELSLTLPTKIEAIHILLIFYLREIVNHPEKGCEAMMAIDNDLYSQFLQENRLELTNTKFVGEELGLEKMYAWYRELQDFQDNGMLLYYSDLPREKQHEKFLQHLVEEAQILLNKIEALKAES